jgi:hypothetical protein
LADAAKGQVETRRQFEGLLPRHIQHVVRCTSITNLPTHRHHSSFGPCHHWADTHPNSAPTTCIVPRNVVSSLCSSYQSLYSSLTVLVISSSLSQFQSSIHSSSHHHGTRRILMLLRGPKLVTCFSAQLSGQHHHCTAALNMHLQLSHFAGSLFPTRYPIITAFSCSSKPSVITYLCDSAEVAAANPQANATVVTKLLGVAWKKESADTVKEKVATPDIRITRVTEPM